MKVNAVNSTVTPPNTEQKPAVAVNTGATDESQKAAGANPAKLVEAVEKLNKDAEASNREVRFALYKDTHRIFVEVVDKNTKQVVATFPPKQILKMAESLEQEAKQVHNKG